MTRAHDQVRRIGRVAKEHRYVTTQAAAEQSLPRVRSPFHMAEEVEAGLGVGEVLLQTLCV